MNLLNRIKLKIAREETDYSDHVLDNLDDLNLTKDDINHTIFTCEEIKKEVDFVSTNYTWDMPLTIRRQKSFVHFVMSC